MMKDVYIQRLVDEKPSQADLDTAVRVLRWLSDHAQFFPDEYYEGACVDLAKAANQCYVNRDDLLLTESEIAARDAHNTLEPSLTLDLDPAVFDEDREFLPGNPAEYGDST